MRSKMEKSYTTRREDSQPVVRRETGQQPRHIQHQTHPVQPSFFNAPLQPQPINQPVLRLDPGVVFLIAALVKELHTQNEIELAKLKAKEEEKRKEAEAAEKEREAAIKEQQEADKRFEEVRTSLYL